MTREIHLPFTAFISSSTAKIIALLLLIVCSQHSFRTVSTRCGDVMVMLSARKQ